VRSQGLDLLRGIAVALVVLRHALPDAFPGAGVVGVVMFFALSGHLITGVLVTEFARRGRIDLRRFYARRARRLVPALVLLVAVYVVVTLTVDPLGERESLARTTVVALTWTGNLPHLVPAGATFHLWTLATEEQFYLVWPVALAAALQRGRTGVLVGVGLVLGVLATAATVAWLREAPDLAYPLPTSWATCFVVGAGSRLVARRLTVPGPVRCAAVGVSLVLLALASVIPLRGHALTYLVGGPGIAVLTAVLVLAWRGWTTVKGPLRAVVWLGTVSYGLYLWNYPITRWLPPAHDGIASVLMTAVVTTALSIAVAAASWYVVERPAAPRRADLALAA
jgi:peptidoglycan/LPS O-acetylase OafA/YrhL